MEEVSRLFDFPYYQLKKYNLDDALVTKKNKQWIKTSSKEYIERANAISRALLKLGIKKDDKIAVISSTNRTEWNITDIGILQTGAQSVPIYPTISKEDYSYILNHAECTYCIISDKEVLDKVLAIKDEVTSLKDIYSFDRLENCSSWNSLLELGKDSSNQATLDSIKSQITKDDLATIIYTSGTTGKPKGVMLTHNNIVSNVINSSKRVPLSPGSTKALSFLPVCHIFERMILYLYQYYGISIYFA